MTWEIKAGLMGKGTSSESAYGPIEDFNSIPVQEESTNHLFSFFPNIALTKEEFAVQRDIGQRRLWPTVRPLPGVQKLIAHLSKHKIPIVVATSSKRSNFLLKSAHLHQEVFGCFGCGVQGSREMVICADDVSDKTIGKPDPYIFLYAAREKLGRGVGHGEENVGSEHELERGKGLVFEDAILGVEAGKRAGMSGAFFERLETRC